jgi:hypothetical protein
LGARSKITASVAAAAGLVALVSICRRISGPDLADPPRRLWKCTACGHEFELSFREAARQQGGPSAKAPDRPDPWSLPVAAPKGEAAPLLETVPCPKCSGEARRYIALRCTECGEEFRHLEALDGATAAPKNGEASQQPRKLKQPVCPACGGTSVVPR